MELTYDNNKVKKLFLDFELIRKKTGNDLTRAIKARFDQLKAADNYGIFLSTGLGNPHLLEGNLRGKFKRVLCN